MMPLWRWCLLEDDASWKMMTLGRWWLSEDDASWKTVPLFGNEASLPFDDKACLRMMPLWWWWFIYADVSMVMHVASMIKELLTGLGHNTCKFSWFFIKLIQNWSPLQKIFDPIVHTIPEGQRFQWCRVPTKLYVYDTSTSCMLWEEKSFFNFTFFSVNHPWKKPIFEGHQSSQGTLE